MTTQIRELPKAYEPGRFEAAIYERWLSADVFAPDGAGARSEPGLQPFVIIQPPPNVTGALHLGHALTSTIEDAMIRHARMRGHPTLWLPGLDHASIAAQYVLDRLLAEEGESRESLGRERYLERMWQFITETREVMLGQQRRIGASLDWSRLRFTMDEGSARAVRESFARLYRDGLAYRTEALINWCPGCRTSISDLEVIPTEETGSLWTIRYHLVDPGTHRPLQGEWVSVATTRPETILGDTAVAVHPDDERYRALVGRKVRIPFVERDVPIIADDVVDRAFGTGAVKITPAHDRDDYETGRRHRLASITVLNDDATINEAGERFAGLDRYEARRHIIAELEGMGDLEGSRPHEMLIGRCQRSNDVVEPRLKTQWFIRTEPLAQAALEATRSRETVIVPARFEKVWESWLTNIHDWNVSRQLWWGHRIPAWYCPDGHVTVSAHADGPSACDTCGRPADELTQDPDIFDTWFSSGLWPFSTLGWPERTDDLARFYPGSVMETGYDIIFFWVARMMMLGIHLTDTVPFRKVYLHGLVKDPVGAKMAKSKGNVVDPLEAISTTGADALRFALLNGTSPGNDQKYRPERLEEGRNFANKLWNATRFVLGARPASVRPNARRRSPDPVSLGPTERWIRARAGAAVDAVDRGFQADNYGEVTRVLYEAIWGEFCDWGLELAKVRLADEALPAAARAATWWTLVEALDTYLRLLHPVMPFVTEALWDTLPHAEDDPQLLIVARWPSAGARTGSEAGDRDAERSVDAMIELIRGVRNARSEAGIEPSLRLDAELTGIEPALVPFIERLARLNPSDVTSPGGGPTVVVTTTTAQAVLWIGRQASGADVIDRDRARLEKELAEAERHLAAARARLADGAFVSKAPPSVVDGTRAREAELVERVARLRERVGS